MTLRQRKGDQPLPQTGQIDVGPEVLKEVDLASRSNVVFAAVRRDFEERITLGVERYGHPLQTNNGRDAGLDAYQELLDAAHYLKQLELETHSSRVRLAYWSVLDLVFDIREWLGVAPPCT